MAAGESYKLDYMAPGIVVSGTISGSGFRGGGGGVGGGGGGGLESPDVF